MTAEEDFIAALDAEPGNHFLRLVYADWLEERCDPRGPGMRALGLLGRLPHYSYGSWSYHNGQGVSDEPPALPEHSLPEEWLVHMNMATHFWSTDMPSRAAAENAAALAWARLTPEQQAAIFADAGVTV